MGERWFGGSHLLRAGRCSLTGHVYMLTACTRDRKPLLQQIRPARILVAALHEAEEEGMVRSIAHVVMPDHFHWLVRLGPVSQLSAVMQAVKGRSAMRMNRELGATGPVWQDSFHDRAVRRGEDLRTLARYIVANPLRAGLVEDIGQWPHWDAVWLEGGEEDRPLEP